MEIEVWKENLEIEIKIQMSEQDTYKFMEWLKDNASYIGKKVQIDKYFENKNCSFLYIDQKGNKDANQWLRIRTVDESESWLCYKKCHRDKSGIILYSDEIESKIQNPDNLCRIFNELGYYIIVEVKKDRTSYKCTDFQIDVDNINGIGKLIEIEFSGKLADLQVGRQLIEDFLRQIGFENYKVINSSYPYMMINKCIIK